MEKEKDKLLKMKFLMFENEKNICWLDASISLVVHNKTFKKIVECSSESKINKIISAYYEAINILNSYDNTREQRISKTRKILFNIQKSTLEYLKHFLKFKPGEPDSAFCALLNLIYEDKSNIKEHLNVSWFWRKRCSNCGTRSKSGTYSKPIITLAKVHSFHPEHPSSIYMCSCKLEQEMTLIYKELPSCLIFHFEKGAGRDSRFPVTFFIKGRKYQLTSIVILKKGSDLDLNHFVTWVRNPFFNTWLECNDLNSGSISFSVQKPEFDFRDLYMCVFEAFDNLNKITNNAVSIDEEQDNANINVEVIDISDEVDDTNNIDFGCKTKASKFSKVFKNDRIGETSISMQNMKMHSNEKSKEKPCNISSQNVPDRNLWLPNKISPKKYENVAKSKNLYCQDKVVDEIVKVKELKAKVSVYTGLKSTNASFENKKTIVFSSSSINNKAKESEKIRNISSQNISVNSHRFTSKISLDKHKNETKQKKIYCKNIADDLSGETKEFKVEAAAYPWLKVTDSSVGNKKKISSSFTSDSVIEDVSVNDIIHKKQSSEKKITHTDKIPSEIFEDTSDVRTYKVDEHDGNKLQIEMNEISLKKNEDKYVDLGKEKRKRTEDKQKETSNKLRKEKTDVTYVSSSTGKKYSDLSVQTASTSVADNDIAKRTLQQSKRTSKSKIPDYYRKKAKMVDHDNVDKKENNKNVPYKINDEKIINIVDSVIQRIFAVFFKDILQEH